MSRQQWLSYGLDDVSVNTYEVLLSYPNASDPNLVNKKNASLN